ncbi:YmfL family putative regulatory protein [Pantoea agglomerans]|uniref:YmfL family putative regulatory protein n=1 Tax=Enterobacter agglomerans TaxID=549 RepID=UPI002412FC32|nr:YmfL family putative regulatory protein [Pantoea agglomerans]
MNEPEWKVEKQPVWLVAAIRKTIASLAGGYAEAAEILDVSQDAIFNRLRNGGDQIFPLGWALVLQQAGGTHHIANAVAKISGGVFVPLPEIEEVDYGDINQRLLEAIEQITRYSQQVRAAIDDGVIEPHERQAIDEELYCAIAKLQEHTTLVYRVFCESEKSDARECAAPGAVANKSLCMEKSA